MAPASACHWRQYPKMINGLKSEAQILPRCSEMLSIFQAYKSVSNQPSQWALNAIRRCHVITPCKSRHQHNHTRGDVAQQCYSKLPPYAPTDIHSRYGVVHDPTWRLCAPSAFPQGIIPSLPETRPCIGLSLVQVGGLA